MIEEPAKQLSLFDVDVTLLSKAVDLWKKYLAILATAEQLEREVYLDKEQAIDQKDLQKKISARKRKIQSCIRKAEEYKTQAIDTFFEVNFVLDLWEDESNYIDIEDRL